MKKRILTSIVALIAASSLTIAGCGSSSSSKSSTSSAPKDGGTLTIALSAVPKTLDPVKYTGIYEGNIINNVCSTLVYYNKSLNKMIPGLATEWKVSSDMKSYTFKLRNDVYFQKGKYQSGRKMTAQDVKYSLERSAKESAMKRLRMLDSVEVVSDTEIIAHLKQPNATFLTVLTDPGNVIVPKEEVEGWGSDFGTHLVGTGAFSLKEWRKGDSVVLTRNDKYFAGKPHLDGVTFKFITDQNMMSNALKSGDVDVATDVMGEGIQAIKNDSNLVMSQQSALKVMYGSMNLMTGPTKDKRVREAILSAIDVDALVKGLYPFGEAQRGYLPLPSGSWGYDKSLESSVPKYDPEKAKELMKEAGYPNGFTLDLYLSGNNDKLGVIIQDYLKKNLGITVKINMLEWGAFSDIVSKGKAGMYCMSWTWYPDPDFFLYQMFDSKQIGSLGNGQGYNNPKVDKLLNEAVSSTVDQNKRADLYKQALKLIEADYPRLDYGAGRINDGYNKKVHGFERGADGSIFVTNPERNVWKE